MFTIEFTGIDAFAQTLQRLATEAEQALVQAIQAEAARILEATYPDVPVDTGQLVSSGAVLPQADGADIRFGNFGAVPYAIKIHEDTSLNHPRGGTHHFLSKNVFEATGDMPQRLAAAMAPRLRR